MTVTHEEISAVLRRYLAVHPDRAADVRGHVEPGDSSRYGAALREAHLHADFRFAVRATDTQITPQLEEVIAVAWRSPVDLPTARLADSVAVI
ncbi:hypothetical protein AB0K16_04925 [Nonomuraea jabiensis]|uniref:hypothetical protein n=1 Tax=Nonomuraea jabiensis TaxID=882448 RepID=UPI00343CC4B1